MAASLLRSRATWIAILLSLTALFLLRESLFDAWNESRLSAARVCFRHVGMSEKLLPRICVSSEARAPDGPDVIDVFVSRGDLESFIDLVAEEPSAQPAEMSAFGAYELDNSLQPPSARRTLARAEMQVIIGDLIDLLDAEQQRWKRGPLEQLRRTLAVAVGDKRAAGSGLNADAVGASASTARSGHP